eukprot:4956-Heterococcus_DN1.PRE.5
MPADNLAAWLHGVDDLRVEPYNEQVRTDLNARADMQPCAISSTGAAAVTKELKANEVRIRVGAVGICGSDVHYLKHMQCGSFVVKKPMVIGHESAGILLTCSTRHSYTTVRTTEVGPGVTHLSVGQRVAMEPGIPCRCCSLCKEGTYNLCETLEFFATPPVHGSLANYVVHPADFCFALPDGMSLEEGAMCEPVSVGIHACRRGGVGPGSIVLILGAGPIGLVTLLVAKAFGATDIVVTDMSSERLAIAEQLGATATVNVTRHTTEQSAAAVAAALGNRKPTVTADCCGYESSMATALEATKSGGKVCLIGMGCQQMTLPLTTSASREIDILGVFRYRNTYPLAIQMISKGAIDVQPLITDRYDLQQDFSQATVVKAFEQSAKGKHTIKVMFTLVDSAGAK